MKKTVSISVIYVGKDTTHLNSISSFCQELDIGLITVESLSQAKKKLVSNNMVVLVIDILDAKTLYNTLELVVEGASDNVSFLCTVDMKHVNAELLRYCEEGCLDCLIKPLTRELFIGRIKHFLNKFKLKLSLEQEVSERENLLCSLLDEKRYAESLINSSMDMIISVDLNRKIFEFNTRAQEIFGYTKDEIIGKPVDLLYADEEQSVSVYEHTLENQQYSAEIVNRRKNGDLFPSLISASILVERGGQTLGLMGISRDISDLKKVEADLKKAKEDAEAASRAKSEFLTNMSHEIRTPMASIIGYAELLEDGCTKNQELLEFVGRIKHNGQHLLRLINDILDLSQVEKGKLTLHHVYCSPFNIITNLSHIMRGRSDDKNVSFDVKYQGKIPKFIHSDPTRILQCLVNLVGNAIKFTPEGGNVLILVEYFPDDTNPLLCFKVKDTGIGIPPEKLSLIMQPFEQGDIPCDLSFQGVGLGLPITHRLAHLLGGSLVVESQHEIGSIFSLTVKCGETASSIELLDANSADIMASAFDSDDDEKHAVQLKVLNGRILLAEDNGDIRKLITKILKEAGATVDAVETGPCVLEKTASKKYDLILMDVHLPLMDGMTVVQKLRKKGYKRPIIALTASAMRERLSGFVEAGCNDYAVKPISRKDLTNLAHKWLEYSGEDGGPSVSRVKKSSTRERRDKATDGQKVSKNRYTAKKGGEVNSNVRNLIYSAYHDDPEMQDIVREYVGTLPIKLKNIATSLKKNDFLTLKKIVHGLHGSGGGFGI